MSYVLLDDKFHSNEKTLEVGNAGAGLYSRALSYCGDHLTDGFVPLSWAREAGTPKLCRSLTDAGLWVEVQPGAEFHYVTDDESYTVSIKKRGFFIPDFLSLNPSAQSVKARREELSAKRAEAGRKGAMKRWQRGNKGDGKPDSKTMANEKQTDGPQPLPLPLKNEGANAPPGLPAEVRRVYDYWREKRGKTRSNYERISDGRRKKIQARLREFTADDLCRAIDGIALDPWEGRALQDDLTVVFRSTEQVDKFLELAATGGNVEGAAAHNEFQAYMRQKLEVVNGG